MADEIDRAQEREQQQRDAAIAAASRQLERGHRGKCDRCGEPSKRLVHREGHGDVCAPCRDRYRLG